MGKDAAYSDMHFSGKEKRVYERHPVNIDAVVQLNGQGELRRKIRDFCIGGMLLVDDEHAADSADYYTTRAAVNDVIQIRCAIPSIEALAGKPCLLEGRIVRVDSTSIGVAFVNPALNTLQGLIDYAKSSNHAIHTSDVDQDNKDSERPAAYTEVMQQCCVMVKASLEPIVFTSIETIIDKLFEASKATKIISEQNSFFEGLDILNKLKARLAEKFVLSANGQLGKSSLVVNSFSDLDVADISLGELSLVEDETLDNWLADTGTIEAVERANREVLDALHKRLTVVFGFEVNRTNNPFGPSLFSHSFQDAIQDVGLRHNVNLFAYKVFKDVLTRELAGLYVTMNDMLVKNGVMPEFKYSLPIQKPQHKKKHDLLSSNNEITDKENNAVEEIPANSGITQTGTPGRNASDVMAGERDSGKSIPEKSQSDSQRASTGQSGVTQATGNNSSINEHAGRGERPPLPETEQDIYALVDELHQLRQRLGTTGHRSQHGVAGHETESRGVNEFLSETVAAGALASDEEQIQAEKILFTQSEVLHALANVEQNITTLDRSEIRKGIAAALMRNSDGTPKEVGGREDRIINVSTSIFDTMLSDLQVPVNMREWLARLEMPVLKMAIHDDSLYRNSDHLVRQVVNKIAKLGLLVGEEETEGQSGIRNALDWLINLIKSEFDGTEDVFRRVSDQLDVLVKAQDKKYKENISKVIQYIEAHKNDLAVDDELIEVNTPDDEAVSEDWNRRVKRLAENDWLLFDVKTERPVRLKVAWVAEHSGVIVFVNAEGKKERVLHLESVANSLSLGNAQIIDDANAPTMDRAQYTTLQKLNRDLIYESTHDQLTGLINRREFEKELAAAFAESRGAGSQHAMCFIDIDQFKVINTNLSNVAGDELLVQVSSWVNGYLSDLNKTTFARLGGDEFGIIFHDCPLEDALAISEELIELVAEHKFEWRDQCISISASIGLVQVTEYSESVSALMQAAEASCDIAKQTGGNRLQLFYAGNAKLSQRKGMISWVTKIDDILSGDGLELRCQRIQPIANIKGVVEHVHYEILLGLKSDQDNLPSIQEFIEAAEYSNRIGQIDRWVVKESISWIAANEQVLDIIDAFSINISGKSLSDETFIDFVIDQIEQSGIPAECLCFEITETAGVENLSDAAYFINTIKETGCRFSLDDFGSGMSSYAYLRDLPVDYLKIDGMFIKNIHNSGSDYAVVKSITEVAHFMGKRVIAEYVENDEIIDMLVKIGVDFAQGYGVEKPHLIGELI